jgi:hypothetical protein
MIKKIDALSFTRRNFLKGLGITTASLLVPKNIILAAQDQGQNIEGFAKIADELKPYVESIDSEKLENVISALSEALKRLSDFVFEENEDDTLDSILDDIESAQKQMWEDVFLKLEESGFPDALDSSLEEIIYDSSCVELFKEYGGPKLMDAGFFDEDIEAFTNPENFDEIVEYVISEGSEKIFRTGMNEINWADEIYAHLEKIENKLPVLRSITRGGPKATEGLILGLSGIGKSFWEKVGLIIQGTAGALMVGAGVILIIVPEPVISKSASAALIGTGTYMYGGAIKEAGKK